LSDVLPETVNPFCFYILKTNLTPPPVKLNPKTDLKIIEEAFAEILMPSAMYLFAKNLEKKKWLLPIYR
jgi:hypothetical protein